VNGGLARIPARTRALIAVSVVFADGTLVGVIGRVVPEDCIVAEHVSLWCTRPEPWVPVLFLALALPIAALAIIRRHSEHAKGVFAPLVIIGMFGGVLAAFFALGAMRYECGDEIPCTLPEQLLGPAVVAIGAGTGSYCGTFGGAAGHQLARYAWERLMWVLERAGVVETRLG
jgi:hypothetical protein